MKHRRSNSHAFILRLWAEPREIDGVPAAWRGLIQHVETGAQRYFCDLEDVPGFVRPYLSEDHTRRDRMRDAFSLGELRGRRRTDPEGQT